MKKFFKYGSFCVIAIFIVASFSIMISQTAFAGTKNPISLPTGIWAINAGDQKGELNIPSVSPDGQITGTVRFGIGTPNEYTNKIFGFWDADAWKITFLRETGLVWANPNHPPIPNTGHGRDQIFTGYMFGGLPCPAQCTATGAPITMAGTYEAFGGTTGTGGTADRSVFGWVATHPVAPLTHPVP
jgi:hypothetical protein